MNLSCDFCLNMNETEAKSLWSYLNSKDSDLDGTLRSLMMRLESQLWDSLSIEDMTVKGTHELHG